MADCPFCGHPKTDAQHPMLIVVPRRLCNDWRECGCILTEDWRDPLEKAEEK